MMSKSPGFKETLRVVENAVPLDELSQRSTNQNDIADGGQRTISFDVESDHSRTPEAAKPLPSIGSK